MYMHILQFGDVLRAEMQNISSENLEEWSGLSRVK